MAEQWHAWPPPGDGHYWLDGLYMEPSIVQVENGRVCYPGVSERDYLDARRPAWRWARVSPHPPLESIP